MEAGIRVKIQVINVPVNVKAPCDNTDPDKSEWMNTLIIQTTSTNHTVSLDPGYPLAAAGCIKLGRGQLCFHFIMIRIDVDHLSIESIAN